MAYRFHWLLRALPRGKHDSNKHILWPILHLHVLCDQHQAPFL